MDSWPYTHENVGQPQPIVLLEDMDLYRYQHNQQHYASSQAQLYASQSHDARRPMRTSSHPTSDVTSDRSEYPRQYRLHATPYGHSNMPKPSFTSIDTVPICHGAIRPGGAVNLFTRQHIGLLLNWSLVGFFNGSLSSLVFPVFGVFLGYSDYQTNAAFTLINVPWNFKFFMGFLSDCIPINRQRRKPYIFIGWTVFMLFMIALTCMDEPHSIQDDPNAASQGPKYVIVIMVGSLGHLLATIAVEGMMVEFAQREGEYTRGRTQCWCIIARYTGESLGTLSVALALNSRPFGGDFAAAVPLRVIFGVHVVLSAIGLIITKFLLHDDPTSTSTQRISSQLRRIWSIMQKRTTCQITIFGFIARIGTSYEIPNHGGILTSWLHAGTVVLNINNAISSIGYIFAAAMFMIWLLNTNWRKLFITVMVFSVLVMVPVDVVTVFDIERSLPLYLAKAQLVSICNAFVFILRVVVIVEVAEPGYEAVTYGVLTTVFNLGSTVVAMCKNIVASRWSDHIAKAKYDTSAVRWHFMREFFFKYGLRLVVILLVLWLLPRQKRHLRQLNMRGPPTVLIPIVLFLLFTALFVASMTSNMLALFESTACLVFAGGQGCGHKQNV